ncbi:MAG: glycogen/starch/alpha-glucan phosphorylase [Solobacterium sp.]|jgi:starch phosphorylase|nr:glycogen/starch/alpha-glucan phosphorylase [Solobacterium sp.]MCH4049419.1 glycogen/starch/alpha-glucan phosphorylase [Solobacterium sp.]MCH4075275.1 glycogen/starch/alpha-glucan phosphorylase [Solobacterium sp.]MCI1313812.1 glycogen/starch/alpha-glucan phosphorylase [Solobacterium sp.]MCI1346205.1 glycogen/starch/alpha-glucan phosphorylase [Solobacterium sp.]
MFRNKVEFKKEYTRRLVESYGCAVEETHPTEKYMVLGEMVRDFANVNWKDTKVVARAKDAKQVYYFSMEFLLGRMLTSNLQNLGIYDMVVEGLKELGIDYNELADLEADPGLGNGGLGRLAACFMDSSASEGYMVNGNCIRYRAGLFRQFINKKGEQVEVPDMWMRIGTPWEIRKPKHAVDVRFYGNIEITYDDKGNMHFRHRNATHIMAVPYDVAMIGAGTKTTNTLRLWSAEPSNYTPRDMEYRKYLSDVDAICLNVYPDDSTDEGKYLRLKQEYFFVCAGVNNIVTTHLKNHPNLDNLPDKVAIQLNDTHPVLVIPELMRVLMDDYQYSWEKAWDIVTRTVAYTNHTVMAEALEKWPVSFIQTLLPRVWMIIAEIDRRYCDMASQHVGNDWAFVERTRPIREGMLHMASLAIIGSHSVNGVAEIHSEILRNDLFRDYTVLYPDKFNNKTNGITHRRWLLYANPQLRNMLDKTIGKSYETDWHHFEDLMKYVDEPTVQDEFLAVKEKRKEILADYVKDLTGEIIDPHSIIDTQAKRLHAYKRQLLNIMQVIYLYQRMKADPNFRIYPHTYLFAAKAASSYAFAKNVIKLINNVAWKVNSDPDTKDYLKVVFLPNYCVTMAETLVPGTDISEQISMAGKEASGTGNMKFMMNGAITLGTLDGANVEIDRLVGRENDVIFGLTVEQLEQMRYNYNAFSYYQNDERIRNVMDTFINGFWTGDGNDFRLIYDELRSKNDEFFVLADFDAYVKAQEEISARYQDRRAWAKSCLVNIAKSGYFSSDRTIEEYVRDIWHINSYKF